MKFTYKWKLIDLEKVINNQLNVFSCFACGGGSTMGYKMTGFNVIGCNEIDPEMMDTYKKNHNPKYSFLESIEIFKLRDDLPKELYNLDILDGSPPCSSFSISGSREKDWGVKKKFREGQSEQVLDDLFFHFIDFAKRIKPKVIVAENVKGMITGNAKGYVKKIISLFKKAGYNVQLFLLNGASMGLPQKRERIFFICHRSDLNFPKLKLNFNERPIPYKEVSDYLGKDYNGINKPYVQEAIQNNYTCMGNYFEKKGHRKMFNTMINYPEKISYTLTSSSAIINDKCKQLSISEIIKISSFPDDYQFKSNNLAGYQMGMSVPPIMMHKISEQIYRQWLEN